MEIVNKLGNFLSILVIILICLGIGELIKKLNYPRLNESIPVFVVLFGGSIGWVGYWIFPNYTIGNNFMEAIAIGIIGGVASTGFNQLYRKIKLIVQRFNMDYSEQLTSRDLNINKSVDTNDK